MSHQNAYSGIISNNWINENEIVRYCAVYAISKLPSCWRSEHIGSVHFAFSTFFSVYSCVLARLAWDEKSFTPPVYSTIMPVFNSQCFNLFRLLHHCLRICRALFCRVSYSGRDCGATLGSVKARKISDWCSSVRQGRASHRRIWKMPRIIIQNIVQNAFSWQTALGFMTWRNPPFMVCTVIGQGILECRVLLELQRVEAVLSDRQQSWSTTRVRLSLKRRRAQLQLILGSERRTFRWAWLMENGGSGLPVRSCSCVIELFPGCERDYESSKNVVVH